MNQIIKISLISFILLTSCYSQKQLYRESEAHTYPSDNDLAVKVESFYRIKRNFKLDIELFNNTESSMLIPIRHLKAQLLFSDVSVKPKVIVSPNYSFDEIEFSSLNNKKRLQIIEDLCLPYLDEKDYQVLEPGGSYLYTCKLHNYNNLKENKEYELKVKFQLTDRIKKYCPKFWSGTTESETFKIKIQ